MNNSVVECLFNTLKNNVQTEQCKDVSNNFGNKCSQLYVRPYV